MCGIAGIVSNLSDVNTGRLKKMTDSIAHRGPDGEGHWISGNGIVGLGHRRLSIIDLTDGGRQPMHYMDRYTITFNGEIYNYIELKDDLQKKGYGFRSHSDTEVIMALYDCYKEACLQYLDGMFAFAIYDEKAQTLFCARDRFGEKPFHYACEEGKYVVFASEMKAIWAAGIARQVNNNMLYNYLQYDLTINPADQTTTFFENIKRLDQSHYLLIDIATLKIQVKRYWDINIKEAPLPISFNEACDRFRQLFYTSVQRRLRSDVPVGSSLSGGLDSSLVVCTIDALNSNKQIHQKTFSARFPGSARDESRYQQLVIDNTGADAFFTSPDEHVMLNEIDKVFFHQEEPFGSPSILAQYEVFKLAKEHNVTVLLDGQGADEVLSGYHAYYLYFFLELEKDKKESARQWSDYIRLHGDNKVNELLKKDLRYGLRKSLPSAFEWMKKAEKMMKRNRGFLTRDFYAQGRADEFERKSNFHNLNGILKQSTMGGGLQELLRYADRNSMAHSREIRLPFLSHELVEFLFKLPATYKMNKGWTKYIMREAFADLLPPEITWRVDKIGYEPPQKKWMESGAVKEMIHESRRTLVKSGILEKKVLNPGSMDEGAGKTDKRWATWMAAKLIDHS